jgi:zinc/manganese transport system substrate-binding protein
VGTGPPLAVIGTENFYADLLTQIGGSRVRATSFLNDPNADPHAFESNAQDAALVADAKLVIVNGLGYDAFMQKLLGASSKPDRVVLDVQQLLGLPDTVNVHVWYGPATMPKVAAAVSDALGKLDPQNTAYYAAREQAYLAALKPIADKSAELKAKYAGTPIAFTENVAGYLTDEIGLVVKTPAGFMKAIEQGTDPAPADVAAERDLFTAKAVRVLPHDQGDPRPRPAAGDPDRRRRRDDPAELPDIPGLAARPARGPRAGPGQGRLRQWRHRSSASTTRRSSIAGVASGATSRSRSTRPRSWRSLARTAQARRRSCGSSWV